MPVPPSSPSSRTRTSLFRLSALLLVLSLATISHCEIVVGVLTLFTKPISKLIKSKTKSLSLHRRARIARLVKKSSYISDTYTRWLEDAGIRVVALDITHSTKRLLREMDRLDGLLLTGGKEGFYKDVIVGRDTDFGRRRFSKQKVPTVYLAKVAAMVRRAKVLNNRMKNFPIWATCLGFEALLVVDSKFTLSRHVVNNRSHGGPIQIQTRRCNVLNFFSAKDKRIIQTKNTFYFNHKYALYTSEVMRNRYLRNNIRPIANIYKNKRKLLAVFEYKDYPFLGSQFHPERFATFQNISRSNPNYARIRINHKLALLFRRFIVSGFRMPHRHGYFGPVKTSARKVAHLKNIGSYRDIAVYQGPSAF